MHAVGRRRQQIAHTRLTGRAPGRLRRFGKAIGPAEGEGPCTGLEIGRCAALAIHPAEPGRCGLPRRSPVVEGLWSIVAGLHNLGTLAAETSRSEGLSLG
jgi:hypothetical protein